MHSRSDLPDSGEWWICLWALESKDANIVHKEWHIFKWKINLNRNHRVGV